MEIAVGVAGVLGFLLSLVLGAHEIRKNTCRIKADFIDLFFKAGNYHFLALISLSNRSRVACSVNSMILKILDVGFYPSEDGFSYTEHGTKVIVTYIKHFPLRLEPYETKRVLFRFFIDSIYIPSNWEGKYARIIMTTSHGIKGIKGRITTVGVFRDYVKFLCRDYPNIVSREKVEEVN